MRTVTDVDVTAARIGRVPGIGAIVAGMVDLGIVLDWFDYFSGGGR